jgi:hypothetical protein
MAILRPVKEQWVELSEEQLHYMKSSRYWQNRLSAKLFPSIEEYSKLLPENNIVNIPCGIRPLDLDGYIQLPQELLNVRLDETNAELLRSIVLSVYEIMTPPAFESILRQTAANPHLNFRFCHIKTMDGAYEPNLAPTLKLAVSTAGRKLAYELLEEAKQASSKEFLSR